MVQPVERGIIGGAAVTGVDAIKGGLLGVVAATLIGAAVIGLPIVGIATMAFGAQAALTGTPLVIAGIGSLIGGAMGLLGGGVIGGTVGTVAGAFRGANRASEENAAYKSEALALAQKRQVELNQALMTANNPARDEALYRQGGIDAINAAQQQLAGESKVDRINRERAAQQGAGRQMS